MSFEINRIKYANMYGPTTGDKIRLADTELFIEIEKDHTVYGDEIKFGGGKTIRDGMAQSSTRCRHEGVLDMVITGAIIIDHWGIVKADIGIKDGNIVAIGNTSVIILNEKNSTYIRYQVIEKKIQENGWMNYKCVDMLAKEYLEVTVPKERNFVGVYTDCNFLRCGTIKIYTNEN